MLNLLSLLLLVAAQDQMYELIEKSQSAALGTMLKDTPFVSIIPYAIDEKGSPIVMASDLAVHTKNLKKNSKCSLMISKENKKDVFNSERVTFIGKMEKVPYKEVEAVKKAYLAKHPGQEYLLDFVDFTFYRMKIEKIFYIGGFGDINWIDVDDYLEHWEK